MCGLCQLTEHSIWQRPAKHIVQRQVATEPLSCSLFVGCAHRQCALMLHPKRTSNLWTRFVEWQPQGIATQGGKTSQHTRWLRCCIQARHMCVYMQSVCCKNISDKLTKNSPLVSHPFCTATVPDTAVAVDVALVSVASPDSHTATCSRQFIYAFLLPSDQKNFPATALCV